MTLLLSQTWEHASHTWESLDPTIPFMDTNATEVLAATLRRLCAPGQRFESITALGARADLGKSTVDRLKKGESAPTLTTLDKIAHAYSLQPWQMLVPDVDPAHPPKLYSDVLEPQDIAMLDAFQLLTIPEREGLIAQALAILRERDARKSLRA